MTIQEALKRFRKEFSLTQKDVADKLSLLPQGYQIYESKVTPSAEVIKKIANAYDISADYLLGRSDNPKNHKITPAEIKLLESVKSFLSEKNL